MDNVAGAVEIAVSVFGGQNIELSPTDLPQGLSPACLDVAFLPGSTFTRPSLKRFLTVPDNTQVLYARSYVKNDGTVVQLLFDSLGRLWANGVQIGTAAAGNRIKTISAFGREYIAISDGLHGANVPLQYDGTHLDRVSQDGPAGAPKLVNFPGTTEALVSLTRTGNAVTATTATEHNLSIGRGVSLRDVDAMVIGGGVTSIVINNVNAPGVATFTTASAHGLVPGSVVAIKGVVAVAVGGGLATTTVHSGVEECTTNQPHTLGVGSRILVSVGRGSYSAATVASVPSATVFTFGTSAPDTTANGGAVLLQWPESATASQNLYSVTEAPTDTTFQVPITYPDGKWNSGTVTFSWSGTFYVASTPSLTTFAYKQKGPDGSASTGSVSPIGQIEPGEHSCVCIFRTRTGAYLAPGPRVTFTANGGQYARADDIPIGPPNVVGRALAFTPANGGKFFILPVAPQINGQILGTSTVIDDNTTTSVTLDFSDQALLAGIGIDISGNDLFSQVVLGPCLGLFPYSGRLFAWGERNKINQFWNMGFEGGYSSLAATQPLGWTVVGDVSLEVGGDYGQALRFNGDATISQLAYQDQYGIAILEPNTQYTFRCWGPATAELFSATGGSLGIATVTGSGGFREGVFSRKTPRVIPPDTVLRISARAGSLLDELEIYYTDNPYLRTVRASYVNKPEAFDGVTGLIGPANDPNEVRALFERKDVLHFLTSGPNGSLYESQDTPSGEPATWNIQHVASKCGAVSVWGDAQFEDWQVWASDTGLRIYDGGFVEKMSQEIQPWWDSFNPLAKQLIVVANDPYQRRIYVLASTGSASALSSTYHLDYRELNTAAALESSGPLRIGMGGKVFTTDLTRKWSPWSIRANFVALMQDNGVARAVFCGGASSTGSVFGSIYTLNEGVIDGLDDDYGQFLSQYTSYYFISQDEAQQYHLGTHRKLYTYLTASISGKGSVIVTPLVDRSGFEWRPTRPWKLSSTPNFDMESALSVSGDRVAFRFAAVPDKAGSSGFYLTNLVVALKDHPFSPVRGSNA